jgi:hypothetical protein
VPRRFVAAQTHDEIGLGFVGVPSTPHAQRTSTSRLASSLWLLASLSAKTSAVSTMRRPSIPIPLSLSCARGSLAPTGLSVPAGGRGSRARPEQQL